MKRATIAFRPVTVRCGLIRGAILDAITPEIFLPPRQENKRSFWEPASYDDLSAHFNGVPSVAVTTLDVDPSFVYVLAFLRTRPLACADLYR
ncbi:hypothetical protein ALC56_05856 [Trachymyrmex septentrionalis]|uniref:Uncharacterized protein n=1 Tax=Trachymyrmex septentrionalis TaxID=34720 RepID=A0A151JXA9_9HYME|nr:hypothetical protein ALC56_05856 [Trachymyrmex septentrionalis]